MPLFLLRWLPLGRKNKSTLGNRSTYGSNPDLQASLRAADHIASASRNPSAKRRQTIPPVTAPGRTLQSKPDILYPALFQGTYTTIYQAVFAGSFVSVRAVRGVTAIPFVSEALENESKMWSNLDHENILEFKFTMFEPHLSPYLCTVTEWCNDGNLTDFLRPKATSLPARIILALGVISAIKYLHSQGIVHGDLKPSNVLIMDGSAKVCDFNIPEEVRDELSQDMTMTLARVDALRYLPIERVVDRTAIATAVGDIWSLACIILQILYYQPPYSRIKASGNDSQLSLLTEISKQRPPASRPSNLSRGEAELWKLILEPSWVARGNRRPKAAEIYHRLQHIAIAPSGSLPQ